MYNTQTHSLACIECFTLQQGRKVCVHMFDRYAVIVHKVYTQYMCIYVLLGVYVSAMLRIHENNVCASYG